VLQLRPGRRCTRTGPAPLNSGSWTRAAASRRQSVGARHSHPGSGPTNRAGAAPRPASGRRAARRRLRGCGSGSWSGPCESATGARGGRGSGRPPRRRCLAALRLLALSPAAQLAASKRRRSATACSHFCRRTCSRARSGPPRAREGISLPADEDRLVGVVRGRRPVDSRRPAGASRGPGRLRPGKPPQRGRSSGARPSCSPLRTSAPVRAVVKHERHAELLPENDGKGPGLSCKEKCRPRVSPASLSAFRSPCHPFGERPV